MKKIFILCAVCAAALSVPSAKASIFSWKSVPEEPAAGESLRATLFLDTEGKDINAVEGTAVLPSSFALEGIYDGNSVVNIWLEPPHAVSPRTLSFSGIMPAGYEGTQGKLFEIVMRPERVGPASLDISGARALENDGRGSETKLTTVPLVLNPSPSSDAASSSLPKTASDRVPPEEFTPVVARDPSIENGKYFLVFATTDKGVGVNHYEVMEVLSRTGNPLLNQWHVAESPYILKDQTLRSDIYVRAVDRAGNFRVVAPRAPSAFPAITHFRSVSVFLLIVVLLCIAYLVARARRRSSV